MLKSHTLFHNKLLLTIVTGVALLLFGLIFWWLDGSRLFLPEPRLVAEFAPADIFSSDFALSSSEKAQLCIPSRSGVNLLSEPGLKIVSSVGANRFITGSGHLAISPDANTIAIPVDEKIELWDVATSTQRATLNGHEHFAGHLTFSPNGKLLASSSLGDRKTIIVWDVAAARMMKSIDEPEVLRSLAFSPDSHTLLSAKDDGTIKLWDVDSGECRTVIKAHGWIAASVAVSPDGSKFVSGCYDGTARIWTFPSGQLVDTVSANVGSVYSVAFASDSKTIAIGGGDFGMFYTPPGRIELWDIEQKKRKMAFKAHTTVVTKVQFSPTSDQRLYSMDYSGTLRVWGLENLK
jgi:WD40 repeat protein